MFILIQFIYLVFEVFHRLQFHKLNLICYYLYPVYFYSVFIITFNYCYFCAAADLVAPVFAGCPQGAINATIPVGQTKTFVTWTAPNATDAVDPNPTVTSYRGPSLGSLPSSCLRI